MAYPFASQAPTPLETLQLLQAPSGQLSADGQLRELMQERRRHHQSSNGGLWYLSPALMQSLGHLDGMEGLVIADPAAATWLQLRFGGQISPTSLATDSLDQMALALPAAAVAAAPIRMRRAADGVKPMSSKEP